MVVACASEPTTRVMRPPMRSEIHPHSCRLRNAHTKRTESMAAPVVALRPTSPQKAIRCEAGIAIGTQHRNEAVASRAKAAFGGRPRTVLLPAAAAAPGVGSGCSGAACRNSAAMRQHHPHHQDAEAHHGLPPAVDGNHALEDGRPDRPGDVLAAGDQRERRAAPHLEPAGDIDVERRVDGGVAEQAHEQAMADIELPGLSARRQHQPNAHHDGAQHDHAPHAEPVGEPAHGQSADAGPDHAEGKGGRRDGAVAAEIGCDGLQGDGHDQGCGKADGRNGEGRNGDLPSFPAVDLAAHCVILVSALGRCCPKMHRDCPKNAPWMTPCRPDKAHISHRDAVPGKIGRAADGAGVSPPYRARRTVTRGGG